MHYAYIFFDDIQLTPGSQVHPSLRLTWSETANLVKDRT